MAADEGSQPGSVIMHRLKRPATEQAHHHRRGEGIARPDRVDDRACLRLPGRHHAVSHEQGGTMATRVGKASAAFVLRGVRLQPADLLDEVPDPLGK